MNHLELHQILTTSTSSYRDYLTKKFYNYKTICLFGMGALGRVTLSILLDNNLNANYIFCDNNDNKASAIYKGVTCITLKELLALPSDEVLILIATVHFDEIYIQLKQLGFHHIDRILMNKFEVDQYFTSHSIDKIEANLNQVMSLLADQESQRILLKIIEGWMKNPYTPGEYKTIYSPEQYFPEDIITLTDHEIFIDGGAYTGDTLDDFIRKTNKCFKQIHCFELNTNVYKKLQNKIHKDYFDLKDKIETYPLGLCDSKKTVQYSDEEAASCIGTGALIGQVADLDTVLGDQDVTFIKMDIEGSEIAALKGAQHLIKRCRPTLAICIYHAAADYWNIPLYIKTLVPEYQLYIRHHTDLLIETVCYAIMPKKEATGFEMEK